MIYPQGPCRDCTIREVGCHTSECVVWKNYMDAKAEFKRKIAHIQTAHQDFMGRVIDRKTIRGK